MTEKFITVMTVVLLMACIAFFIHYEQMRAIELALGEDESTTINASTVFLMMLPLLFYEKNRFILYAEVAICVFFIVSAVKRGNIVAAVLPLTLLLWYQYSISKRNAISLLVFLVAVVLGSYFLQEFLSNSYYFILRLEETMEGDSSGRDLIYAEAFNIWYNSDFSQLLFGNGFRAVTRTIGTPAHSDWIEILVDNGVLGIVFYIGVFISFFSIIRHTRPSLEKLVLWSAFLAWFAKSVYSMAYVENWMCLLMISIGLAMNRSKQEVEVQDELH